MKRPLLDGADARTLVYALFNKKYKTTKEYIDEINELEQYIVYNFTLTFDSACILALMCSERDMLYLLFN